MKILCTLLARDVRPSGPNPGRRSFGEIGLDLVGVFHIARAPAFPASLAFTVVVILQAEPEDGDGDCLLHVRIVDEYGQPMYRTESPFVLHVQSGNADPLAPLPAALTIDSIDIARPASYTVEVLGNDVLLRQLSLQVLGPDN